VAALSDYQAQVQDLLHDPLAQQWPTSSLTNYINEARNRLAQDTKCLRQILTPDVYPSMQFVQGTEFITPQTFLPSPFGAQLVDVLNIVVIVNQQRTTLLYRPYTWLTTFMRSWANYQQWPQFWSRVSPIQFCIAPVPNITYTTEWDVAINPTPMVNLTDQDTIPIPFQEPVQYYAAYKAKINQQSQGEAAFFLNEYQRVKKACFAGYATRIIPNPYSSPT
jgi:hypothetical protein